MALTQDHIDWLDARKLCPEEAIKAGCYSRGPMLAFPYLKDGQELYAKLRGTVKKQMLCHPAGIAQTRLWCAALRVRWCVGCRASPAYLGLCNRGMSPLQRNIFSATAVPPMA